MHAGQPATRRRWWISAGRAIVDETAATSKAVVQADHGRTASHAYFSGCSDGGREALMEAQRFPEDYDGIVAVAPANFWTQVLPTAIWDEQALVAEPGGALTARKLSAITAAVLAACHGEDGILDNPSQCRFDPSVRTTRKEAESDACLTPQQISTLQKIYSGRQDAAGNWSSRVSSRVARQIQAAGRCGSLGMVLSRMNRNQRGCSIALRRLDNRGCHGERTDRTLRRPDFRGAVLLRPGCCNRDASHCVLRRRDDPVPLNQGHPHFRANLKLPYLYVT